MGLYDMKPCSCNSGNTRYPLFDENGIFLAFVCGTCETQVKSKYRPSIFGPQVVYSDGCNEFGERIEDDY